MRIQLKYGKKGLNVHLPDERIAGVLHMRPVAPLSDPQATIGQALSKPTASPPLRELARGKKSACVVVSDITRPVPNPILLPPMLRVLEESGIPREAITILIATGIHRPNEGDELVAILGPDIVRNYRIVNHCAREPEHMISLGTTSRGTPILLNRTYMQADLRITTALIEPHLMAGYSGGRKAICPGIAGLDTVKIMHGPRILEHPSAREGVMKGNPFHEEVIEMARKARVDFILNVTLNEQRQITGVFAGDLEAAHEAGVAWVENQVKATLSEPVDIVVTTSAGYPLDLTFYQAIKGMTAVLPIVKQGGTMILAAQCAEGIGSPEFTQLIRTTKSPEAFMEQVWKPDFFVVDQWQLEEECKALRKAEVYFYTDGGIPPEEVGDLLVKPARSVEWAVQEALRKHGPEAKIAVIPEGPYVLTVVEHE